MNRYVSLSTAIGLCAVSLCCILCSGCLGFGYRVGAKSLFASDIKTVYVPIFQSDEISRDLSQRLTEAVCKRIEAKSPYKVIGRPTADSILEGRIVSRTHRKSISNNYNDPRQKTETMTVEVTWRDRGNRDLRHFDSIPWNDGSGQVTATNYLVAEYGQSEMTTAQTQIDQVAAQIVGMMETPW